MIFKLPCPARARSGALAAAVALAIAGAPAAWAQRLAEEWLLQDPAQTQTFIPSEEALADVEVDSQLRLYVEQLDDPSFEIREAATQELRKAALDNRELYAMLTDQGLGPEQRYRLLNVIREQLQLRGAVGISVDQRRIPGEIFIEGFIEGLPAERTLQIGDQITHMEGRELPSWEEFRNVVQSMRPGKKITVTIRRPLRGNDGRVQVDAQDRPLVEVMDVELELGSAEKLRDPATGRRQMGGMLDIERRREVREAVHRFGPQSQRIAVRGGMDALVALAPTRMTELLDETDRDPEIESYPDIMLIREHRRLLQEGIIEDSPQLRTEWQMRLRYILVRADQPGQSREFLLKVAERFAELMRD